MDSYFGRDSMLRRIQGERAVMLAGPRALLMQAAHPLAVEGLLAHTGDLEAPYERLERTAEVMTEIAYGSRERADRMTRRVRAMHRRVRGQLERDVGPFPKGTPYAADDPELLMWVLFGLVDSGMVVYERFVERLSRDEKEAYWADFRIVGELFGLEPDQMPADLAGLDRYRDEMYASGRIYVSFWARTRAREIVLDPPVPLAARPLVRAVNQITIALLPDPIRRGYGFAPIPPQVRELQLAALSSYVRRFVLPMLPRRMRRTPASIRANGTSQSSKGPPSPRFRRRDAETAPASPGPTSGR
jgi:uncharacterized protein (DUF2236 family)